MKLHCTVLSFAFLLSQQLFASSEFEACEFVKKNLSISLHLNIYCSKKNLLFCHKSNKNKCAGINNSKKINVLGHNVFKLGHSQFKDELSLAKLLSSWDLIPTVEIMHWPRKEFQTQRDIVKFLKSSTKTFKIKNHNSKIVTKDIKEIKKFQNPPAYIRVLLNMLKENKNWSLVMSPDTFSVKKNDIANNELAGFYFRNDKVQLTQNIYCKDHSCTIKEKDLKGRVRRKPFLASFKGKNRVFTTASIHTRFSPPGNIHLKKIITNFDVNKFTGHKFSKAVRARFGEVATIITFLGERRSSLPGGLLLYGDYNLNAPKINKKSKTAEDKIYIQAWHEGVLKPLRDPNILPNGKTTLSESELVSSYDHFILDSIGRDFCKESTAKVINFMKLKKFSSWRTNLLEKAKKKSPLNEKLSAVKLINKNQITPLYSTKKTKKLKTQYRERVTKKITQKPTVLFKELVSDHLPIAITCDI